MKLFIIAYLTSNVVYVAYSGKDKQHCSLPEMII